ncbi:FG-GAP-like repeat-containing protein [Arthrobacter sp. OVS8]|nr:FG-GAP-like repeat-containing protein [Arthrobacter sp. OVS8]
MEVLHGRRRGFRRLPLWTAYWPSSASNYAGPLPSSWSSYSFWQYSESGPFAGDSNVWNGDYEGLRRFASNSGASLNTPVDDFNGDGRNDLLSVRADGALWFYPGNGQGGFTSPVRIGTGWRIYSRIVGVGDLNGDGRNDFTAIKPDGSMWFYAGTGTVGAGSQGYASAIKMGTTNWSAFSQVAGVRDFNGDGRNDLVASKKDGTLWFFAGTRTVSSTQSGHAPALKIGSSGWEAYTSIVGVRNFGGKPTNDLLATKTDGSLWFYDGTGTVSATNPGYAPGTRIGTSGWNNFLDVLGAGDLNGDGKSDLLTRRRDNALLFYAGTGMNEAATSRPSTSAPPAGTTSPSWSPFRTSTGTSGRTSWQWPRTVPSGSTPQPGPMATLPAARSGPAGTPTPSSLAQATSTATAKAISSPSGPTEVSGFMQAPGTCPPAVKATPPAGRWAQAGTSTASSSRPVTSTKTAKTTWPASARTAPSGSTTAPGRCPPPMRGTPRRQGWIRVVKLPFRRRRRGS